MITLRLKVKPNARVDALAQLDDGSWLAQVRAAPVDGKANAAVIELVARAFGVAKSRVSIRSGAGTRLKRVEIAPPPP
jgi:uncharacterized protein YggU (UPF0235/DUF167 family)